VSTQNAPTRQLVCHNPPQGRRPPGARCRRLHPEVVPSKSQVKDRISVMQILISNTSTVSSQSSMSFSDATRAVTNDYYTSRIPFCWSYQKGHCARDMCRFKHEYSNLHVSVPLTSLIFLLTSYPRTILRNVLCRKTQFFISWGLSRPH
jgi:hypothetical protein